MRTLVSLHRAFNVDNDLRKEIQTFLSALPAAAAAAVAPDPREDRISKCVAHMRQTITGVTRLDNTAFVARVHVSGCPRFGAVRADTNAVSRDLLALKQRAGDEEELEAALRRMHVQHDMGVLEPIDRSEAAPAPAVASNSSSNSSSNKDAATAGQDVVALQPAPATTQPQALSFDDLFD